MHCEKYPVIYINKKVVYFKTGKGQEFLDHMYISGVKDNLVPFLVGYRNRPIYNQYFWGIAPHIDEIFQEIIRQQREIRSKLAEEITMSAAEKAKKDYEKALKRIELIQKARENISGKKKI